MPSREELRSPKKKWPLRIITLAVLGIVVLVLMGVLLWRMGAASQHGHSDFKQARSVTTKKTKKRESQKRAASESTADTESVESPDVTGIGFHLMPVLYNGENVNDAMDAGRAPLNTVHDNGMMGYFETASNARVGGVSATFFPHDMPYSVEGGRIHIDDMVIPYTLVDGVLRAERTVKTYPDGTKITWELTQDDGARQEVDRRTESSNREAASRVDQHNLTTAQLEHWVRAYLESTRTHYVASELHMKQDFVDGYAQIRVYTVNSDHYELFRVNGDGELEQYYETSDDWDVVSSTYF